MGECRAAGYIHSLVVANRNLYAFYTGLGSEDKISLTRAVSSRKELPGALPPDHRPLVAVRASHGQEEQGDEDERAGGHAGRP